MPSEERSQDVSNRGEFGNGGPSRADPCGGNRLVRESHTCEPTETRKGPPLPFHLQKSMPGGAPQSWIKNGRWPRAPVTRERIRNLAQELSWSLLSCHSPAKDADTQSLGAQGGVCPLVWAMFLIESSASSSSELGRLVSAVGTPWTLQPKRSGYGPHDGG